MTRIFRYVLMNDTGMAPNPRQGLVTLATCKPGIRQAGAEGDWVIGNFPAPNNEVVAWAGKIEKSLPIHTYAREFASRDDALHELGSDGELRRIPGRHEWYHQGVDQQRKDRKGRVLVFDKRQSWYFGSDGRPLPIELHHLAAHGQGHRVNLRQPGDLERLVEWLHEQGSPGVHGEPRDGWEGPSGSGCRSRGPKPVIKPRSC